MNKKQSEEISGLRARLETCRKELHKEKQKNKDLQKSRAKYKARAKELDNKLRAEDLLKKNEGSPVSPNKLSSDTGILTSP
jgi:chromosome segregation ATPase